MTTKELLDDYINYIGQLADDEYDNANRLERESQQARKRGNEHAKAQGRLVALRDAGAIK